jgi:hypothetical protein
MFSFGDVVTSISLLSSCNIVFTNPNSKEKIELFMERRSDFFCCTSFLLFGDSRLWFILINRSVVVLRGDARFVWKHGIECNSEDKCDGVMYKRKKRISLTYREAIQHFYDIFSFWFFDLFHCFLPVGLWFKNIWTSKGRKRRRYDLAVDDSRTVSHSSVDWTILSYFFFARSNELHFIQWWDSRLLRACIVASIDYLFKMAVAKALNRYLIKDIDEELTLLVMFFCLYKFLFINLFVNLVRLSFWMS